MTSADSGAGVTSDKRGETSSAENASYETMSAIDGQTTPAKDLKPAAAQNSHVNHDNKPTSADVDVTRVKQEASDVARFNLNADDCKTPLKHEPSDVADVIKPREQPPLMNGHVDDNRVKQLLKDCIKASARKLLSATVSSQKTMVHSAQNTNFVTTSSRVMSITSQLMSTVSHATSTASHVMSIVS